MRNLKIGLQCSPSKILNHKIFDVTEYLLSYGGSMGGVNQSFYSVRVINSFDLYKQIELYTGEQIDIYNNFIVTARKKRLLEVVTDVTAHSNYHKKTCESNINTAYYLLNHGDNITMYNEINKDNRKLHIVKQFNIIT